MHSDEMNELVSDISRRLSTFKKFRTTDGEMFNNRLQACRHQSRLIFLEWYKGRKIEQPYSRHKEGDHSGPVDAETVMEWLIINKKAVRDFLAMQEGGFEDE